MSVGMLGMASAGARDLEADARGGDALSAALWQLDEAGVPYCLLRGQDDILAGRAVEDVDLLVAPRHLRRLPALLADAGFVPLRRWGRAPHHFFLGYDERGDRWLKLDVVTELAFGHPSPLLRTGLADGCLRDRVARAGLWQPAPADEFVALLLHCLLDKRRFPPAHRARLAALARAHPDERGVADRLARCCDGAALASAVSLAAGGEWDALLAEGERLADRLARAAPLARRALAARGKALRFLERRTRWLRERGIAVALLAPDGAGKTTLAATLGATFALPARTVYMGTNPESSTHSLPTTRWLARAAPGDDGLLLRGLAALNAVLEQGARYRVGAYHRWRGRLVIFDRYPPDALARPQGGPRHKRLRRRLVRALCPVPDLVICLDAPAAVLYERKQDHPPEVLEALRQRDLALASGLEQAVVVDARPEPEAVRRRVTAILWRRYASRGRARPRRGAAGAGDRTGAVGA